jgi:hypothetical protein
MRKFAEPRLLRRDTLNTFTEAQEAEESLEDDKVREPLVLPPIVSAPFSRPADNNRNNLPSSRLGALPALTNDYMHKSRAKVNPAKEERARLVRVFEREREKINQLHREVSSFRENNSSSATGVEGATHQNAAPTQETPETFSLRGRPLEHGNTVSAKVLSMNERYSSVSSAQAGIVETYSSLETRGYEGEFYITDISSAPIALVHVPILQSTREWAGNRFIIEIDNDSVVELSTPPMTGVNSSNGAVFAGSTLKYGSHGSHVLQAIGQQYNTDFEVVPGCDVEIFEKIFNSQKYRDYVAEQRKSPKLMDNNQLRLFIQRIASDTVRWRSGLECARFVRKNLNKPEVIANKLTAKLTSGVSRTVQVNIGVPYKKLLDWLKSHATELTNEHGIRDRISTISSKMETVTFKTPELDNYKNTYKGFLAHCELALLELSERKDNIKKNVGLLLHPKTSPEDAFGVLPMLSKEAFAELKVIMKDKLSTYPKHLTTLISNLEEIRRLREEDQGLPLIIERNRDIDNREIQEKFHTMNRPDTRVKTPLISLNGTLEAGIVLEARDTTAPINVITPFAPKKLLSKR